MQTEKILFISDLDGTLLNKNSRLDAEGIALINEIIQRDDMILTFATARDLTSVKKVIPEIQLRYPIITANGAFILEPQTEEMLYGSYFDEKEKAHLDQLFLEQKALPLVYAHHEDKIPTISWEKGRETEGMNYYLSQRQNDPRLRPLAQKERNLLMNGKIYCINLMDSKENLTALFEAISSTKQYYTIFHQELYREEWWLSIYPKTTNKGLTATKLKALLKADQLIVFGDNTNDIPLFEVADEAYAVENSHDNLKKLATDIIGKNTDNAVPKWIKHHY